MDFMDIQEICGGTEYEYGDYDVELLGLNGTCRPGKMPAASPLHAVQYSHTIFNPFLYDSSFHGDNQSEVFAYSQRLDGGFCSDLPLDDIVPAEPFPATTKQVTIFSPTSRDISGVRWVDKVPQGWVGSDVVDWLFDLAEKFGVSYEDLNINAFSNLSGLQLMRLPVEEFIHRDVKYGRAIHQAFQMVVATSGGPPHENTPIQPAHSSEIKIEDFGFFFSDCDDQNYRSNSNFESHATSDPMNVAQGPTSDNQGRCLNIEYPSEGLNQGFYCDIPGSSQAYNTHEPEVCPEDYDSISDEDRRTPIPKTPEVKLGKPLKRIKRLGDRNFGRLWEFIRDLLHNPLYCPNMVRWENVDEGVFRIVKSEQLAGLWGHIKNNPKMTYEKLSRAMRYYYKSRVFLPVLGRRLVYKFGPNAVNWRPADPNFENMRSQQSAANAGVPPLNQYEEYDIYH